MIEKQDQINFENSNFMNFSWSCCYFESFSTAVAVESTETVVELDSQNEEALLVRGSCDPSCVDGCNCVRAPLEGSSCRLGHKSVHNDSCNRIVEAFHTRVGSPAA